jgi:hypothetical protein
MSLGGLLGSALMGAVGGGANAASQVAEQTIQDRRQKALEMMRNEREDAIRSEDRQFRKEDMQTQRQWGLEDFDRQRAAQVEDRDLGFQHATKLAGMRASGGTGAARLPPQAAAIWKQVEFYQKQANDLNLTDEQRSQASAMANQAMQAYQQMTGTSMGSGLLGGQMQQDYGDAINSALSKHQGSQDRASLQALETTDRMNRTINPQPEPTPKGLGSRMIESIPRSGPSAAPYVVGSDIGGRSESAQMFGVVINKLQSDQPLNDTETMVAKQFYSNLPPNLQQKIQ